jgi:hypothetical protein
LALGAKDAVPVRVRNMKHSEENDENDEGLPDVLAQIPDRLIVAKEELDRAVYAEYSG